MRPRRDTLEIAMIRPINLLYGNNVTTTREYKVYKKAQPSLTNPRDAV